MVMTGQKKDKLEMVLATRNRGKVSEFRTLLQGPDVEISCLNDFGPLPVVEEDGRTFEENALKKARFAARILGFPSIADDSGLVVNALDGMPGIHSARYAGQSAGDKENNLRLLRALEGVKDRSAFFMCVIAIAVPSGPALIYEGRCDGFITEKPAGNQGFGYDPLFYYPPLKKTFAEMSIAEKNCISHRGRALAEVKSELGKIRIWIQQRMKPAP